MPLLDPIFKYVSGTTLVVTFVIGYIILYAVSVFFSWHRKKPGRNPFLIPVQLSGPKPLVTDTRERDAVLKQGFSDKRLPDKIDAIVVGSGIGGMTTAALLARSGKRVLVLEQHDQAGGCCHTYVEKGYEFDIGIHYIGNMHTGGSSRMLIDQISDGRLNWVPIDDDYDVVHMGPMDKGRRVTYVKGRQQLKERLYQEFPKEKKAIDTFFDMLTKVRKSTSHSVLLKVLPLWLVRPIVSSGLLNIFSAYFKLNSISMQQFLDQITTDDHLKCVLGYDYGDYGTLPSNVPITMHAALVNHFIEGGYYPEGGASEIAFSIIPVIEKAGGRVLVRANVTQLLVDENNTKVVGVRVQKSTGDKTTTDIRAPLVITAGGIINTARILPQPLLERSSIPSIVKKIDSGLGCFSLYVGLKIGKTDLARKGIRAQNMWAFIDPRTDEVTRKFLGMNIDDALNSPVPLMFISFPSTKDPTWEARYPGKSTLAIITFGRWDWLQEWKDKPVKHRGDDYESLKAAFQRNMWEQTQDLFPQLRSIDVDYMEMGTPLTNNHYIAAPKGEIYGLDHNITRFSPEATMLLRPDIGVKGLLITGQDILTCGFMGALYSGLLTASHVLNRNLLSDLHKVTHVTKTIKEPAPGKPATNGTHKEVNGKME